MTEGQAKWKRVCKSSKLKMNKVKGKAIGTKMVLVMRTEEGLFGSNALCRHMAWPMHWGGKIKDGCLRCPLHQTTYHLRMAQSTNGLLLIISLRMVSS